MMLVIVVVVSGVFGGSNIVTRPIHVNAVPVSATPNAVAVDSSTNTIYVTNNLPDTVSVIDGWSHVVVATVRVGHHPDGVAVDSTTHTVYVANSDSHTVSVINGSTHTVTATVPVGNTPFGVTVNPVHPQRLRRQLRPPQHGVGDRRVDPHRQRHPACRQRPVRGGGGSCHQRRLRQQLRRPHGVGDRRSDGHPHRLPCLSPTAPTG